MTHSTPVQKHCGFWVKREDLCCDAPGPPFSKMRGVIRRMESRNESVIGVLDTYHSKAGWAVAAAAQITGHRVINFWPVRISEKSNELRAPQSNSQTLGARLHPMQAGRSAILYHQAKKLLPPGSYMMPNALKLEESVEETALEVGRTATRNMSHVVVSASSGTIAGGVLRGLAAKGEQPTVWIHMGYARSHITVLKYLTQLAPDFPPANIQLIDEGYSYSDKAYSSEAAPFPCNEYYDLKAWQFVIGKKWDGKVMFWNVGA